MATHVSKPRPAKPARNGAPERPARGPGAAPVHIQSIDVRDVRAFDRLTVTVPNRPAADEGQWIVVLGENGAGKTTLLRAFACVIARREATSGATKRKVTSGATKRKATSGATKREVTIQPRAVGKRR